MLFRSHNLLQNEINLTVAGKSRVPEVDRQALSNILKWPVDVINRRIAAVKTQKLAAKLASVDSLLDTSTWAPGKANHDSKMPTPQEFTDLIRNLHIFQTHTSTQLAKLTESVVRLAEEGGRTNDQVQNVARRQAEAATNVEKIQAATMVTITENMNATQRMVQDTQEVMREYMNRTTETMDGFTETLEKTMEEQRKTTNQLARVQATQARATTEHLDQVIAANKRKVPEPKMTRDTFPPLDVSNKECSQYENYLNWKRECLRIIQTDRKSTRLNSSHSSVSRMPSSA